MIIILNIIHFPFNNLLIFLSIIMKKNILAKAVLGASLLLSANNAVAEENLWVYTKGTDTRPEGSFELKLSDIIRIGKSSGKYVFHDIRPEIEYGVTDRFTIGAELMIFDHDYAVNDSDLNPMYETQGEAGGSFDKTKIAGYEIAAKYNVLSPYKDSMGLSFGLGYEKRHKYRLDGADINQDSYVGTVFAQKNWLDDTLVFAFNWKTELERRTSPGVLEEEIAFDISAGLSYRVMPKHFIGIEVRQQSDYLSPYNREKDRYDEPELSHSEWDLTDIKLGTQHQSGTYVGPSYHYAEKNWWYTVGILYQVAGDGSEHAYVQDSKNWDEHERIHIGLSYGYEF